MSFFFLLHLYYYVGTFASVNSPHQFTQCVSDLIHSILSASLQPVSSFGNITISVLFSEGNKRHVGCSFNQLWAVVEHVFGLVECLLFLLPVQRSSS